MMNGSIETFAAFKKIVSDKLCQQAEVITVKEKDGTASRLIQKWFIERFPSTFDSR